MLKNAYLLAKIGPDTAENEICKKKCQTFCNYTAPAPRRAVRRGAAWWATGSPVTQKKSALFILRSVASGNVSLRSCQAIEATRIPNGAYRCST